VGGLVHGPAIAEQEDDVDVQPAQLRLEPGRPGVHLAAVVHRAAAIEEPVPGIEIDLVHLRAHGPQVRRKAGEERPHGPLQQQHALS
jgi:hypothetical protein